LIGLSAVLLMVSVGRVAGISGMAARLLPPIRGDFGGAGAFLAGLVLAPVAVRLAGGSLPPLAIETSRLPLLGAGLLVGFGSVWGSGCTSGHGVCGISRLSPRSIVATLVFMATGFATLFVTRHLL
jgi:uncharacterized membrane protein YedE/YeeE